MKAIFDLEGTLTHSKWREIHAKEQRWEEYSILFPYDKPNIEMLSCLRRCNLIGLEVVILTAKFEKDRGLAVKWLQLHNVWDMVSEMVMRKTGDYRRSKTVKEQYVVDNLDDIILAVDDRMDIISMYKSYSIPAIFVDCP